MWVAGLRWWGLCPWSRLYRTNEHGKNGRGLPRFFTGLRFWDTGGAKECHELADEFDAWRITVALGWVDDHLVDEGACGFDCLWVIATRQGRHRR
jgi:hypothetical protein